MRLIPIAFAVRVMRRANAASDPLSAIPMAVARIKNELWAIARGYPTFAGLLSRKLHENGETTVGAHWARILEKQDWDWDHFENVCDDFAMMRRPLPDPSDRLLQVIMEEVSELTWRDSDRLRRYEESQRARDMMGHIRNDKIGAIALDLAFQKKSGRIDKATHDLRLNALMDWEVRDGDKPEFLDAEATDSQ